MTTTGALVAVKTGDQRGHQQVDRRNCGDADRSSSGTLPISSGRPRIGHDQHQLESAATMPA
jgi:hypothetical protein